MHCMVHVMEYDGMRSVIQISADRQGEKIVCMAITDSQKSDLDLFLTHDALEGLKELCEKGLGLLQEASNEFSSTGRK